MLKSIVVIVILALVGSSLAAPAFFAPYGNDAGDALLFRNDDGSSSAVSLIGGMNFFGNIRNSIFVNNNGLLTLDSGTSTYTPRPLHQQGLPTVAAFWADVDTRPADGGDVWYRSTIDAAVTAELSAFIRDTNPGNTFAGTKAFIVTWDRVGVYSMNTAVRNTFQLCLVADATRTYAIMNYGDIQWTVGSVSGNAHARIGFAKGNGVGAELAVSGLIDVVNVEEGTNAFIDGVPQTGRYVFAIGETVVVSDCCAASSAPVLSGTPTELNFDIATIDDVPEFTGTVTATSECTTPAESVVDPTYFSVFGCPVERTWKKIDDCGKTSEVTQYFRYPEVFTEELSMTTPSGFDLGPLTGNCASTPIPSTAVSGEATTNRGTNAVVSFSDSAWAMIDGVCTLNRFWVARDICRKEVLGVQVITIGGVVDVSTGAITTGQLLPPLISVQEFCANQGITEGESALYCNVAGTGYYSCMSGAFNILSVEMPCASPLRCNCGAGIACDPVCDW